MAITNKCGRATYPKLTSMPGVTIMASLQPLTVSLESLANCAGLWRSLRSVYSPRRGSWTKRITQMLFLVTRFPKLPWNRRAPAPYLFVVEVETREGESLDACLAMRPEQFEYKRKCWYFLFPTRYNLCSHFLIYNTVQCPTIMKWRRNWLWKKNMNAVFPGEFA